MDVRDHRAGVCCALLLAACQACAATTPEEAKVKYARQLPEYKKRLATGDTQGRKAVLVELLKAPALLRLLDDSFLEAFIACAKDPDAGVRAEVARMVGSRWVWGQKEQNEQAISLMLDLSKDPAARHNAVYFGLSVVQPKSEEVIRRLVSMAVEEYDGRIAWGLRGEGDRATPLLTPYLDRYRNNPDAALRAYLLFLDVTGREPPRPERFANLGAFVVRFWAKPPFDSDGSKLLEEFRQSLPGRVRIRHLTTMKTAGRVMGMALVDGLAGRKAVLESLKDSKRIAVDPRPIIAGREIRRRLGIAPVGRGDRALPAAVRSAQEVTYEQAFNDLYQNLARRYPNFRLKGIDWEKVGGELLPRAKTVKTDEQFGLLCMELLARLEDSHCFLREGRAKPPSARSPRWDPGFACLIDDRGEPVVYYVDKGGPGERAGVKIGMTVVSVNRTPAKQAMEEWMKQQSRYWGYSSRRYQQYHAARFFTRQMQRGANVRLVMREPSGRTHNFRAPATLRVRYLPRLPVPIEGISDSANTSWTKLPGNVGYIYVRRIRRNLIQSLDRAIGELGGVRGLIIDVRGNSGGGFDAARAHRNFALDDPHEPQRPRFKGPIALVIDERCISAGEGWASWFIARKRARVFGTATAGASARKTTYTLTNGLYKVTFPVKAYRGFLDRPIERRGLEPDVPVRQTARDLVAGRDTVLEAAKRHLLGNETKP